MMTKAKAKEAIHPNGFPMSEVSCERCFHFHDNALGGNPDYPVDSAYGECWRFPAKVQRGKAEWCGDFTPQTEA